MTSKHSSNDNYPSSRGSPIHHPPSQSSTGRRSPTKDPHSRRSPTRDMYNNPRSPTRDTHRDRQHPQQFPPVQPPVSPYHQVRPVAPVQHVSSVGLPLLRLGGARFITGPSAVPQIPVSLPPPPITAYHPTQPYVPVAPRPLAMLHLPPQLPPPVAISPQAVRLEQQKHSFVQNIMQQYVETNRPRLQLLQMRPHRRTTETNELMIPMPAPNVVTKSTENKVDAGIQAEVPRQDGFVIEPGLFQVSYFTFKTPNKSCFVSSIFIIDIIT